MGRTTPEEANRVSLFAARILEAIAGAGDSLSLQRIAKSVKKLSVWSPDCELTQMK